MHCRALTCVCLLGLSGLAQEPSERSAEQATIAHHYELGAAFAFVVEVESSLRFADEKRNTSMRFLLEFAAKVDREDSGMAGILCELARLQTKVQSPEVELQYDSRTDERPPRPLQSLLDLIGGRFRVWVDPQGSLREVEVPDALAAAADQSLGSDFRSLFAAYFWPLPQGTLAVGQDFAAESLVFAMRPQLRPATLRATRQPDEDGLAVLTYLVDLPPPPPRPGIRFDVRQASASVRFDTRKGRVARAEAYVLARATNTHGKGEESGTTQLVLKARELGPTQDRPAPAADKQKN